VKNFNQFCQKIAKLSKFRDDQRGATAIEYGLIVALVCLGILAGIGELGTQVENMYEEIRSKFVAA
jgi:pilus assembly protein Flp/PilA